MVFQFTPNHPNSHRFSAGFPQIIQIPIGFRHSFPHIIHIFLLVLPHGFPLPPPKPIFPVPRRRKEAPAAARRQLRPAVQRHEDQRLAAEARRLGDLQQILGSKGEDGAEGLAAGSCWQL